MCRTKALILQEWAFLLVEFGWNSDEERLERICAQIVKNDLFKWPQLGKAADPSAWNGMQEFHAEELDVIRDIAKVGRKRPR